LPTPTKILPLALRRSALSSPGPLGLLPTRKMYYESLKPSLRLSVVVTDLSVGKAQSYSSISTPFNTPYI
jgi:hypothetical protein